MKKHIVTIEEHVAKDFAVYAESAEEALKIAEKKYKDCEFVLEPGEVQDRQMSIDGSDNWIKF